MDFVDLVKIAVPVLASVVSIMLAWANLKGRIEVFGNEIRHLDKSLDKIVRDFETHENRCIGLHDIHSKEIAEHALEIARLQRDNGGRRHPNGDF